MNMKGFLGEINFMYEYEQASPEIEIQESQQSSFDWSDSEVACVSEYDHLIQKH